MPDPLISTIIPVLNGEPFLERCFSTLDAQTYPNLEIIFVDNGSTDSSVKMIKNYCSKKLKSRFILCKQKGPAAARNIGLQFADGDFLSFLDVDDEIHADKFNILLTALKNYPQAGMAIGQTKKQYENGSSHIMDLGLLKHGLNPAPEPGLLWLQQFQHNPAIHCFIIDRNILKIVGGFPENIKYGEDVAFLVKIGLECCIVLVEKIVCKYYRHSESAVSVANNKFSPVERYLQFYTKFALPYFSRRRNIKIYKLALATSQNISFQLMMKLIFILKKENFPLNSKLRNLNYPPEFKLYFLFFNFLPYRYANYIYEIINNIFIKIKGLKKINEI